MGKSNPYSHAEQFFEAVPALVRARLWKDLTCAVSDTTVGGRVWSSVDFDEHPDEVADLVSEQYITVQTGSTVGEAEKISRRNHPTTTQKLPFTTSTFSTATNS